MTEEKPEKIPCPHCGEIIVVERWLNEHGLRSMPADHLTAGEFMDKTVEIYERSKEVEDDDVAASGTVETADGEQVEVHLTQAALDIARDRAESDS